MEGAVPLFGLVADLLGGARRDVLVVAPFIKEPVLRRLLERVTDEVSRIRVVTRWKISEVAAGVSDPEVMRLAEQDDRITVELCHRLHAKVFAADDQAIVGSANVTATALGLSAEPNIEVAVSVPAAHPSVVGVLSELDGLCTPASSLLAAVMRSQADLFAASARGSQETHQAWLPVTQSPDRVFPVYSGEDLELPEAVLRGVIEDLAALDVPPGLPHDAFNLVVRRRLHQLPELLGLAEQGSVSGPVLEQSISERRSVTPERAQSAAQRLATWIVHFDDYMITPAGYWEIQRGTVLG